MASLRQRPRLSGWPRPERGFRWSCTPRGKHFQLLHPRRSKQKVQRPLQNYRSQQEKNSPPDTCFSPFFPFDGASKLAAACEPAAPRRKGGTCHFAQGPEPHPPDTCQAGAETPPGSPPRAPEPRPLSPTSRSSAAVGDTEGPSSRRDPAPGGDAPPPDAAAPADAHPRGALPAPAAAAALLAHLARGRSSEPLSWSGSSSGGGGGGGGAGGAATEAAAALRWVLGGMTPCPSRSQRAVRRTRDRGGAHVGSRPALSRLPLQK